MKKIRIDQRNLEPGMTVAKDVIGPGGALLVPSGTTITANHILKINVYEVENIFITVEKPIEDEPTFLYTPVSETAAFIEFSFKYDQQVNQVQDHLSHIVASGEINHKDLSGVVNDVIDTTATRSQLFSYMCRLSSSDDVTYNHSLNVSLLATILGKWLHLGPTHIRDLALAGLLHDIGKIKVDPTILNKKEQLSPKEYDHIKTHTTLGYEIVANSELPIGIKQAVLMHHEKMNGAGYPLGLSWDRIHDYAKIISIVDIYDAMTADRPYHKRFHPFQVIKMFEEECYGILDTKYLYVFLEHIAHNFLGDQVTLSTGEEGEIIFINKQSPSKPLVQLHNNKIIDLINNPTISIVSFI